MTVNDKIDKKNHKHAIIFFTSAIKIADQAAKMPPKSRKINKNIEKLNENDSANSEVRNFATVSLCLCDKKCKSMR